MFARFHGSSAFIVLHVAGIGGWIALNVLPLGVRHVDPFPFPLLAVWVGIEVLFLSAFVLITQRKESERAERREQVVLHLATLAEQETTALIRMLAELREDLGVGRMDAEAEALQVPTDVARVVDALEAVDGERGS